MRKFFKKIRNKIHKKEEKSINDLNQRIEETRLIDRLEDSLYISQEPAIIIVDAHFENGGMKHKVVEPHPINKKFKKFIEEPEEVQILKEARTFPFPYMLSGDKLIQIMNSSRFFMADLMRKEDEAKKTEKELHPYYKENHPELAGIIKNEIQRIKNEKNQEIGCYNIPDNLPNTPDLQRVVSYIPKFRFLNKLQAAINIYNSDEFKQMAGNYETKWFGWYDQPLLFERLNLTFPAAKLIGNMFYPEDIDNIRDVNYFQFKELKNYCQEDLLNKVVIEIARCRRNDRVLKNHFF